MATPTLITVRGTFVRPNGGGPDAGIVSFRSTTYVRHALSDDTMAPGSLSTTLDASGDFSILVPSTNDPDWTPVGWVWEVTIRLSNGKPFSFDAAIPWDTPGGIIEFPDLLPAQPGGMSLYAAFSHGSHVRVLATGAPLPAGLEENTLIVRI